MLPTIDEKKKFALYCHATGAFSTVISACKQILNKPILEKDPLYNFITISIYIVYGRPFTKCWGFGKLNASKLIPNEFKSLHNELMIYRDKIFAHSDKKIEHEDFGPINDIRVTISEYGRCQFWSQPIMPTHAQVKPILELVEALQKKLEYQKEKFIKKYKKKMIGQPGDYLLDTENDNTFFIKRDQEKANIERKYLRQTAPSLGTFKP